MTTPNYKREKNARHVVVVGIGERERERVCVRERYINIERRAKYEH